MKAFQKSSIPRLTAAVASVLLAAAASSSGQTSGAYSWANLGTGDSDALVGLSSTKTYLSAFDLNEAGNTVVNGVTFTGVNGANPTVAGNFSLTGVNNVYGGGGAVPGGLLGPVTNRFVYGSGTTAEVLTLNNLTIGQTYVVTLYNRSWEAAGARVQNLTAGGASVGVAQFDEDIGATGQGSLNVLRYTFQATTATQTLNFVAVNSANTMHQYGFTNELVFTNNWVSGTDWTTSTWSGGGAPVTAGSNASFTAQAAPTTINLDSDLTVGHIQLDGANSWTISSATNRTLNLQADVGGTTALTVVSGAHTITPNIALANDLLKTGTGTVTLSGAISGAFSVRQGGGTMVLSGANTYTGETIIGSGVLEVKTVSDYGVPSAIGARTAAQENTSLTGIGLHFQGGTLKFTGDTAQSTNRQIRVLNGATGGTIDASGSSPAATLSFTYSGINTNLFETGGTRTLTLTGTNTGANSFAIQLINQAASQTALQKTGAGTWYLVNNGNTYTGETIIGGGILNVSSLSDYGVASAIGSRLATEENNSLTGISLHFRGGTLQYTGATPQSTNRQIRMLNTTNTIDASGSTPAATLSFTFSGTNINLYDTGGARTLQLTGTNTGTNTFAIQLTDQAAGTGLTSLTKSGTGTWYVTNSGSTYGGITTVANGILNVSSVSDYGLSSALGNRALAADVSTNIGLLFRGGTLQYTGSTPQSTNRAIRVSTLGGATIDASGSVPTATLSFTATSSPDFFENGGARSLTLTGANTGANTFGMAIPETGGQTSVTKNGAGTWVLTGNSNYTGATSVNNGTLRINGTLGNTPVTVSGTATLGGSGTIGGSVTMSTGSHLTPGAGVGQLTVGGLTLNTGTILDFEFNGTPANDTVTVTGAGGLTLSGGGFNLYSEGTTTPWTANGTYTLFNYNTAIAGSAANLTILNAQAGKFYAITDNPGVAITLTIADATISDWSGGAFDGLWTTTGNWIGGVPNSAGVVAKFGTTPTSPTTVAVNGSKIVGGISFDNTNSYTINGTPADIITLDNGVASASISVVSGNHTINAPLSLNGNLSTSAAAGSTLTLNGTINGASKNLITSGPGTVVLGNANNYAATTLLSGTLQIGNGGTSGSLGSGDVIVSSGANLAFQRSDDVTVSNNLLGTSGSLTKIGNGVLTVSGTNTVGSGVGGAVNINIGTLKLGSAGGLATGVNLALSGGTLDLNGFNLTAGNLNGSGGTVTDSSTVPGTTVFTFTESIAGAFAGNIASGPIRTLDVILGSGAFGHTGILSAANFTVNTGAALNLNRSGSYTLATNLLGATGQVVVNATGTVTLAGTNSFGSTSGGLVVNTGTVKPASPAAIPTGLQLTVNNGTFDVNESNPTLGLLSGTNGIITDNSANPGLSTVTVNQSANSIYSGVINDGPTRILALTKTGNGVLTMAGSTQSNYHGPTSVLGGTLILQKNGVNGVLTDVTIGDTIGTDVLQLGASDQIVDTATINFTAGPSGNSAFFRLNGFNETVQGIQTTVANAAVIENNAGTAGTSTLTVDTAGNSYTYDGVIRDRSTGAGTVFALTKAGNGTLTLANTAQAGATNYTGPTTISNGRLIFDNQQALPSPITNNSAQPDALTFNQTTRALTVGTVISGTGALTKVGTGTLTLSATNTYAGLTTISQGSLVASAAGGGALPGNIILGTGVQNGIFLITTAANQFGPNTVITFNNGTGNDAKFELRGTNQTVAGIQSDADDTLSIIQNQEAGAPALATLTINNALDYVFNGLIRNQAGGGLNIVKTGAGTQEIRNVAAQADNFGTATINQGRLTFNLSGVNNTLGAGTSITVNTGGSLGLDGFWNLTQPVFGTGDVVKLGAGIVTVAGSLSHTGNTSINAGTMLLTGSISGTAKVDILNTGTLAGSGFISPVGNVNLIAGGKLSPGVGTGIAGTLNTQLSGGKFDLSQGVTAVNSQALLFDLDTTSTSDKVFLTGGALNLGSGVMAFDDFAFNPLPGLGEGTYTLFDGDTTIEGTLDSDPSHLIGPVGSLFGRLDFGDSGHDLVLVVIPEPGSASLLVSALASLLGLRRRAKRSIR